MNTTAPVFELHAYFDSYRGTSVPTSVGATAEFPTIEDAQAFVATLPKSLRLTACRLHISRDDVRGLVTFRATLAATGVNGGVNETGLKRLARFEQLVAAEFNPATNVRNAYRTREEFDAALAAA